MSSTFTSSKLAAALLVALLHATAHAFSFPWSDKSPETRAALPDTPTPSSSRSTQRGAPNLADYGAAYLAEGNLQAAIESYEMALRTAPTNAALIHNLGVAKAMVGDYQGGRQLMQRAQELDPNNEIIGTNLYRLKQWLQQRWGLPTQDFSNTRWGNALEINQPPPPLWSEPKTEEKISTTFEDVPKKPARKKKTR